MRCWSRCASTSKGLNIDTPDKVRAVYGTREMHDSDARASRDVAAHLQHRDRGREWTGRRYRPRPGRRPTSTSVDRDYFKSARARDRWPPEHIGPDPQPDRWQPDHRLCAAAGNPERRVRRRRLRQREFELFRIDLRIDPIDQEPDLQPDPGGRDDPVPSSGQRRALPANGFRRKHTWQDALNRGTKSYRILAKADNNYRYVSVRAVPEYPLFVNISVAENTVLAGWLQRSAMIGLGSAALLLCSIYLLIAMTRQVRALSDSEALADSRTSQQLDAALNNMAHGISMFDKDQRLVVVNNRYAAMYNLSPSQVKPGMLARDILEARVAGGRVPGVPQLRGRPPQEMSVGQDYSTIDYLRDGRVIAINHQRMDKRRMGRGPSGHHRAKARRGRARAHGALRRADRPRQSRAVPGKGERSAGAHGEPWRAVLDPDARPRPLQGGQRLAWTCDRRLAAEGGRRTPAADRRATSMSSPGSAATNSRSSRSPAPTSAIRRRSSPTGS